MRRPDLQWRASWLLVTLPCLLALASCSRPAPEQALRETVARMQAAVEARDAGALHEHLAEDFIGPEGMDRDGARRLAQVMFLRNRDIGVTLGPLNVALQDSDATVRFSAALTGGSGSLLPDTARVYDVNTGWRMRDEEWELVSVDWKARL